MGRYKATEYSPALDGTVTARTMSAMDVPAQLIIDEQRGRDVRSGPVLHPELRGESPITIVWDGIRRPDGSQGVLAWYEFTDGRTVSAPQ